jgi:predicted CoA-binding protein
MKTSEQYDRATLQAVLDASSDRNNPDADQIHRMVRDTLRIAVVGISRDPAKAARRVPSYLAAKGGDIVPVNPSAERILGKPVVRALADIDEPVDMVLVFRPSAEAGSIMRQAAALEGHPFIWLQEGIRDDAVAEELRSSGYSVVQDLCLYKVHKALGDTMRRAEERGLDEPEV